MKGKKRRGKEDFERFKIGNSKEEEDLKD